MELGEKICRAMRNGIEVWIKSHAITRLRTDDALMHKNRVAQKRKLQVSWVGLDWQQTASIMQAVQPEYMDVTYPDMLSGTYETRNFYVGDRTAPVKFWFTHKKMMEEISFDFIER